MANAWRNRYVARSGSDPVARKSAERSAASYLRCARSLLAPDAISMLDGVQHGPALKKHQRTRAKIVKRLRIIIGIECEEWGKAHRSGPGAAQR